MIHKSGFRIRVRMAPHPTRFVDPAPDPDPGCQNGSSEARSIYIEVLSLNRNFFHLSVFFIIKFWTRGFSFIYAYLTLLVYQTMQAKT